MPTEKATAIVLRVVEFSETSSVVTLFSREFGKLSGLAKGARRLKSPFESALDLLALCRIVFLRKSSESLDLLTEAKLERRFRPNKKHGGQGELSSLYAAYYVAELLAEFTDQYDPHPELFNAADQTLQALANEGAVASIILRFELTALQRLGHMPSLKFCVECGCPIEAVGALKFGQLSGGVLCSDCRPGKKQVVSVNPEVIQTMVRFADLENYAWRPEPIEKKILGPLRAMLNHYLRQLLGHEPRMHNYLGMLD